MNKFDKFFIDHGIKIILALLIFIFFKSCSFNKKINRTDEKITKLELAVDSLSTILINKVDKLPDATDLKIEGLKVEKRMIQATDRKMMDVQRQNSIEKEIKELEKNK